MCYFSLADNASAFPYPASKLNYFPKVCHNQEIVWALNSRIKPEYIWFFIVVLNHTTKD